MDSNFYGKDEVIMGRLGFVLGTAAKDHQEVLVDQMLDQMKASPAGDTFFYIVPNHIKFQTEIEVLDQLRSRQGKGTADRFATSRVQVLSLSRLAWFLLRDTPALQRPRLSKIGLTMLVAKVVQEHATELQLYASEARQQGFIQKLTDQLNELAGANITATDLTELLARAQKDPDTKVNQAWLAKMHDVELIYHAYEDRVAGQFLGSSELYQQLTQFLQTSPAVKGMHFFIDRFAQFTPGEQQVVNAMIMNANSTTVSFVLDRGYPDQNHHNPGELPELTDLFYPSAMQYHRLWEFAQQHPHDVTLVPNVVMATKDRVSPTLCQVDRFFAQYIKKPLDLTANNVQVNPANLQFFTTVNRRTELDRVATMIHQLVATKGYRYRDFLILSRHLDEYQTMIAPTFAAHDIPIFNDHERQMDNHPLVTLLTALFNLPLYHYRTADIMQLLKTWLFTERNPETGDKQALNQDAVFATENWCLKRAIEGRSTWANANSPLWQVGETGNSGDDKTKDQLQAQLRQVQVFVANHILRFFSDLKTVKTGRELAGRLYHFLKANGVTDRLADWQKYQADKNLDLARQPQQVWATFCQILDEYVQILGDTPITTDNFTTTLADFSELLQAGFAAAQYSQIPATLDQVMISETGITQNQDRKIVFMIGSTDDVMPEIQQRESLLTDQDKDLLSDYLDPDTQYLPAGATGQLRTEPFLHYSGMMTGTEGLVMSAPTASGDDQPITPSPYMVDMEKYFFGQVNVAFPMVASLAGQQRVMDYVSTPQATLSQLVQVERQARNNQPRGPITLAPGWQTVRQALVETAAQLRYSADAIDQEQGRRLTDRLRLVAAGFNYRNQVDNLSEQLAAALYLRHNRGQQILYSSISQLQDYYVNPYEYFLKYGLRLEKRDQLAMSVDRIGTFFHKAMEWFVNTVNGDANLTFSQLAAEPARLNDLVKQSLKVAKDDQPDLEILTQSSHQAAFQYQQLTGIVRTMLTVMCWQAKYTAARPLDTEIRFGRRGTAQADDLQPLDYPLQPKNTHIYLRGQIDRIDQLKQDNKDYLTVVDYKSGNRTFDLTAAYYGLSLQLLAYLNAIAGNRDQLPTRLHAASPDLQLAGALYLHLNNPVINAKDLRNTDLTTFKLRQHQYKGLLLNDPDLLRQLDKNLDKHPLLYPLRKGGGQPTGANPQALLVTPDQLNWLRDRNKQLIIGAGNDILAGKVGLQPYRLLDGQHWRTGLDFTDYSDIYQFDNMLDQQNYRQLDPHLAEDEFRQLGEDDQEGGNK